MMRLILVLGAILLLAACATTDISRQPKLISYPVDAGCHAVPVPDVTVDLVQVGPREDRSLSYRALSQQDTDGQGPSIKHHRATFGITLARVKGEGSFDGGDAPQADGRACLWMTHANLKINWDTRIDIASEIQPGSCPDRAVREHEAKHVALDRRLQPVLEQAIKDVLLQHGRVSTLAPSLTAGQMQVQQEVNQMIQDTISNFMLGRNQQQIAIDTPQEYDRVKLECDLADWVKLVR